MEDFTAVELKTKTDLQIALMKAFGYVDREKMTGEQRMQGALRWTKPEGGEDGKMARILGEICNRADIRAKLLSGATEDLIAEVKFEMEKILYPEIYRGEHPEQTESHAA